jgi:hypothetical protein
VPDLNRQHGADQQREVEPIEQAERREERQAPRPPRASRLERIVADPRGANEHDRERDQTDREDEGGEPAAVGAAIAHRSSSGL